MKSAANFGASISGWEGREKKKRDWFGGLNVVLRNCSQHHEWFLKSLYFCSGDAQLYAGGRHTHVSLPWTTLPSSQPWGFQLNLLDIIQNWIKVLQQTLIYKMWSKLNPHIWNSRNTADGGPEVPLFLAQDHVGSWYHLLKWTSSANHKKDPTEPPTSLKSPKGWRGFSATERTGELALQLFMRFPILLHCLLTNPKGPQSVWRGQHKGSREDGPEEKTLLFLLSRNDSINTFSISSPPKKPF